MGNIKEKKEWFEDWFDSEYYHLLYKNRDQSEAQQFIHNLIFHLNPKRTDKFIDIACGRGRHSKTINDLGYFVHGFDLSKASIESAKCLENESLKFFVNDIRSPLNVDFYDFAFNLFTSFGYFEEDEENFRALQAMAKNLKKGGTLVLDFMNCDKVLNNLVANEAKEVDGITFHIKRSVNNGFIEKNIAFTVNNQPLYFIEKVKIISQKNFQDYFELSGLKIESTFGDYNFSPFNETTSDRLIIVAKK